MSKHTVAVEVFYDGVWNDHTTDVLQSAPLSTRVGVESVTSDLQPASLTFTFKGVRMNPRNPSSDLIGKLDQNTPIRATLDSVAAFYGEITEYREQRAVKADDNLHRVLVTAAGLIQRIGRGKDLLRSPMYRAINFDTPVGFWPLADGRNATVAGSGLPAGQPATPSGTVVFGAVDGPAGDAQKFPEFADSNAGSIVGSVTGSVIGSDTGTWVVEWQFAMTGDTAGAVLEIVHVGFSGGHFTTLVCQCQGEPSNPYIAVYAVDATGTVVDGPFARFIQPTNTGWHHVALRGVQSGASGSITSLIDGVSGGTSTFNRDLGYPNGLFTLSPTAGIFDDPIGTYTSLSIADFAVYASSVTLADHYSASTGWLGESAADRFGRLCDEQGLSWSLVGNASDTQAMGVQGVTTLLDQFNEIERTEWGRIFESRTALELVLRTGVSLFNQDSVLSLSYTGEQISPDTPLDPVVGDTYIRNDVTARAPNGAEGRYEQSAGPYNVNEPGTVEGAVGRYASGLDVNPEDQSLLTSYAGMAVNVGTFNGVWYESVTVDLDAAPSITADVAAVAIGDKITLTDLPTVPGGTIEHLVLRIENDLPVQHRRTVTFRLAPADPFTMGILGATNVEGWLDCDGTTLNEVLDTTETGVDVFITDDCVWGHEDGDYNIRVGTAPEVMTVTAVSAPAGSPPSVTQTLTVVRGVNGIQIAHAIGESVRVDEPFILSIVE